MAILPFHSFYSSASTKHLSICLATLPPLVLTLCFRPRYRILGNQLSRSSQTFDILYSLQCLSKVFFKSRLWTYLAKSVLHGNGICSHHGLGVDGEEVALVVLFDKVCSCHDLTCLINEVWAYIWDWYLVERNFTSCNGIWGSTRSPVWEWEFVIFFSLITSAWANTIAAD